MKCFMPCQECDCALGQCMSERCVNSCCKGVAVALQGTAVTVLACSMPKAHAEILM